ncbi:type IV pilus biogenesis/stability protein PilW [Pasteurellaceae bacterium Macca]|nr:type IV pilus biogenesis/stability protein PilW [Pasteurellaceae bacterium Macca]
MSLTKCLKNLTACFACLWLASCVNKPEPQATFNRSEAVKARINLALAYLAQRDFPQAKENIDKALHHDKQDYLPHSVLAYYYQQIGENQHAESAYQQAITLSQAQNAQKQPRPDVLNNYGTFLCQQLQFDKAQQQFDQALKSTEPYYHQGDTLENIALCANLAKDNAKQQEALNQLEKLDHPRATALKKLLEKR